MSGVALAGTADRARELSDGQTMAAGTSPPAGHPGLDGGQSQYLTFLLDGEEYGVDILRVQEIKGWDRVTPIPNTAEYVRGVINLRGAVVPIIDLRRRFGKEPVEYSKTTVVVVLKVQGEPAGERAAAERTMGFVVDAVSDVHDVPSGQLRPPPELGSGDQAQYVSGLATVEDKMVILLDVDRLADTERM